MSTKENKVIVQRFWDEVFNEGKLEITDEICTEDYIYHGPGGYTMHGPNELKQFIKALRINFLNIKFVVEDMVAEGDEVAHRWTMYATHKETNKPVINKGLIISRFADGRIAEDWESYDRLHAAQQMASGWFQKFMVGTIVKKVAEAIKLP